MNIEKFTFITIVKDTKERFEEELNINDKLLLNFVACNHYIKIEATEDYYIIYNDDIHSYCLSIFKKINSQEELEDIKNYSLKPVEEVDELIKEYEAEQERLRQEEEQEELKINEENIINLD